MMAHNIQVRYGTVRYGTVRYGTVRLRWCSGEDLWGTFRGFKAGRGILLSRLPLLGGRGPRSKKKKISKLSSCPSARRIYPPATALGSGVKIGEHGTQAPRA